MSAKLGTRARYEIRHGAIAGIGIRYRQRGQLARVGVTEALDFRGIQLEELRSARRCQLKAIAEQQDLILHIDGMAALPEVDAVGRGAVGLRTVEGKEALLFEFVSNRKLIHTTDALVESGLQRVDVPVEVALRAGARLERAGTLRAVHERAPRIHRLICDPV